MPKMPLCGHPWMQMQRCSSEAVSTSSTCALLGITDLLQVVRELAAGEDVEICQAWPEP